MPDTERSSTAGAASRGAKVVSIREFLIRGSAAQAAQCARTQRVLAFVETLPPGTGANEADATIID
jgi:hypothetical protein